MLMSKRFITAWTPPFNFKISISSFNDIQKYRNGNNNIYVENVITYK